MENSTELNLDASVKQVMETLPPVVRRYLAEERYTPVVKNLSSKYNLHIDQAGVLEREMLLLLMGIEDPTEFTQALKGEARFDEATIAGITQDINEQIFIPLRKEEEKGGIATVVSQPKPFVVPASAQSFPNQKRITDPESILESGQAEPSFAIPPKPQTVSQPSIKNDIPPNLPGAIPPIAPPAATPPPRPKIRVTPTVTSYEKDPYREPIDESGA